MAPELIAVVAPNSLALVAAVVLDLIAGDPEYRWHPVRLIGRTLTACERGLRGAGLDGYGGGVVLFVALATLWVCGLSALVIAVWLRAPWIGWALHLFVLYSLLALGDLLRHVRAVDRAVLQGGAVAGRAAIARLVGRDTAPMDGDACRRAAIESLGENLTDGFTSPLFWYALLGVPGIVLFKVVSTMDSMVGYKTARYIRFGWCGARLDDAMNFVPARLTWLLIAGAACVVRGCSGRKALAVGWRQHAILPGPNSGWSEAAVAGAIQRRLVGPIRVDGRLVTDLWLGDPQDPPAGSADDLARAISAVLLSGIVAATLVVAALLR